MVLWTWVRALDQGNGVVALAAVVLVVILVGGVFTEDEVARPLRPPYR